MCQDFFERFRIFFVRINLFDEDSTNEAVIENQRLTTRIYLSLMFILLMYVGLVTLTMERSSNGYISSPTENTFKSLSVKHSSTLYCPCQDISILYQSFSHIQYDFHQICSSTFITDDWIHSMYTSNSDHLEMSYFWQIIAGFCRLSRASVQTTINQFYVTALMSAIVVDENLLSIQTRIAFETFLSNSHSVFYRNLMAIQRITAGNQFVSALGSNVDARWSQGWSGSVPMLFVRIFDDCSCQNMDGCPRLLFDGVVSDCFMINAVLQSTFQCYFNETCLSRIHPTSISLINPLNPDNNHLSLVNSTIENLLNRFFLDRFSSTVNFTQYYQQCRPNFCSYNYRRRFDLAYAFSTLIGIFGGLNVVLRFLCPFVAKKFFTQRVLPVQVQTSLQYHPSAVNRINHVRSALWQLITSLNLFQKTFVGEGNLRRERLVTRMFIALISLSVIVCGVYVFFTIQTQAITIAHPSLDLYHKLYQNFSKTLSCPCSQIFIPYRKIVMIDYTLHQICSSTLVSSSWLEYITALHPSESLYRYGFMIDFELLAPSYFQLLATVCSLVQNIFDVALNAFQESHYINQYIPSQSKFLEHMLSLNQSLATSIQQEFLSIQNWLRLMTTNIQLLVGLGMNGRLEPNDNNGLVRIADIMYAKFSVITEDTFAVYQACSCRLLPSLCDIVSVLREVNGTQSYPRRNFIGMHAGCIPWLGLLGTDTTWWYRTDIIEQIHLVMGGHLNNQFDPIIVPLSNQTDTRFPFQNGAYPIFADLLKEALLERWSGDLTRFDLFYQECAPKECNYLIDSRRSRLAALILLISICGGLNQVLRWFSLFFFKMVFYIIDCYRHRLDQGRWNTLKNIRRSLIEWNLFRSRFSDDVRLHQERVQTRLYLGLLSISILIIIVYTSLVERAIVEIINPPSNSTEYAHFRKIYPFSLECPCSRISLEYNTIITHLEIESFHPICSSTFTSSYWLSYLTFYDSIGINFSNQDLNIWIAPMFELLVTFCSIAQQQLKHSLLTFLSSTMVVRRLISSEEFDQQLSRRIVHLQQAIPAEFIQTLNLVRLNQQGNALISVFSSNWQYNVQNNNRTIGAFLSPQPVTYENGTCSCALSQRCSMAASLFEGENYISYTLPGFRIGCTILDAFLGSSFECFYSASCIDTLANNLARGRIPSYPEDWNATGLFHPVNNSLSTFADNDTMEIIVNRMFINRWQHELSYEAFFQGCAVQECTYTRHYRFDAVDVITTFLSIFGALSVVLRFLVPRILTVMHKISRQCRSA